MTWRLTTFALGLAVLATLSGARLVTGQEPAVAPQRAGVRVGDPAVRMIADEGEGAKYWPRWRGPSGQGLASGSEYPDTWSSTQNVLWKTPVPGSGNSSPIVWGDRILLTTAHDGGRRLSLLAYRRSDGRLLWEAAVPTGRTDSGAHYKNGHASATPSTDGERIYVSFGARGLFAFDFNGKIVWQRDLGPMDAYHGAAGSPLLYRDRIILYQDQYGGAFIAAFDTRTGRELWRTRRSARNGRLTDGDDRAARLLQVLDLEAADDEPGIVDFLELGLTREGFTVVGASDGAHALAVLRESPPDLVVLDVGLPGLDGFAVLERIRAESTVPVVMLTARGDVDDRVRGLGLGADDYVAKPFHLEELVARIRAHLRRRSAEPASGWTRLYVDHVNQANEGADLDFLVGRRGSEVGRESH